MNSKILKVLSVLMAGAMSFSVLTSCADPEESSNAGNESTGKFDNNKDALVFSSGEFDGVFNPFFSSSAYDSSVQGQTQIGMLSSDDLGNNVAFGKDQPVVTLDYNETMYDSKGNKTSTGDKNGTTVYQMVLKKDIKFSDGEPLTAHDVLFNMYLYLDPAYTGSSTMYSTDIVGLKNYQMQTNDPVTEQAQEALETTFTALAEQRVEIISAYVSENTSWSDSLNTYNTACQTVGIQETYTEAMINEDVQTVKDTWIEEITSDWNAASSDLAAMQAEYPFTQPWHLYFYNEGIISRKQKAGTTTGVTVYEKDENEKWVIDWQGYDASETYTKEEAIEIVRSTYLGEKGNNDKFVATVLGGWATAGTIQTLFAAEAKQMYYETRKGAVKNIEGIKIKNGSAFTGEKKYNEDYSQYDMLEVTINGVDPKAKWNFSFAVAPMHYYSTPALTAAAMADTTYSENFGVEFSSVDFMNQVKRRNKVPMGAGLYQASTMNDYTYDWSNDAESFDKLADGFLRDNVCYFVRNEYFYTTGGDTQAVYNAKIKHIQYKVVNSANTMTALQGGSIHYADPSATTENIAIVNNNSDLNRIMLKTAGYGYIGINAKYVPNINIRRALMSAMDISLVQNYYPAKLSEPIYRAFSKTSWVYNEFEEEGIEAWDPENIDGENGSSLAEKNLPASNQQYYPYYKNADDTPDMDRIKETIKGYLDDGGCEFKDGKWYDDKGKVIKYTFTVAGDSTDHPAYKTFLNARDILNDMGMEIEVIPDSRALFKLASGSLAIWAAAWSSTIDPDMYQVYHKNSKATSILNWGYDWIKASGTAEEKRLIGEISDLIDEGREKIVAYDRVDSYRTAADKVMELAVELPVYQRSDMYVYNNKVLDATTFKKNPTSFAGPLSEMWKVSFK